MRRALPCALVLAIAAATAGANDMALTRLGTLYQAANGDGGIVVTERLADGASRGVIVPNTADADATSIQVAADGRSGAFYVVWQTGTDSQAHIDFAAFVDEIWYGPYTIAGGDDTAALHPEALLHHTTVPAEWVDDDGNPVMVEVEMTTLHLAWWEQAFVGDDGFAIYAALPIEDNGAPAISQLDPLPLADLLPYGLNCHGIDDATQLTWPKLFVDPESGNPHVLATDLGDCLIQILELETTLADEPGVEPKRRRHVIVLRQQEMLSIDPNLPLASADAAVGHGLQLVLYWDAAQAIDYIRLENGVWSPIRSLALAGDLTHEKATELIRGLVR